MRHLVIGHAQLGNLSQAYNMMLKMQQQGLAVDWSEIDEVEPLREHQVYEHLSKLMEDAGQPFGEVEVWSRLKPEHAMPEAMAYDPDLDRFLVGTIRDGEILVSEDGEEWEVLASSSTLPQLLGVFDLAVDAERGHLWVATGGVSQYQGEPRDDEVRSSLLRLDSETGELLAEYPVSARGGRNLVGSLAVADDGTVFAADVQAPIIYRLLPGEDALRPYFGHSKFTSLRGLALNDDGSLLYIADYELGLFVIDATGGQQAWKVNVPANFNAGGIDGLFYWNDHLVAIQNAITPQRVVRLELEGGGLGVAKVAPLAAAQDEFDTPTYGVMKGRDLFFFGASHWAHVDASGDASTELSSIPIMKVDVDNASVQAVGQEMIDELLRRSEQDGGTTPQG